MRTIQIKARRLAASACLVAIAVASAVRAAPQASRVDLPAQSLERALRTLASSARLDILLDARLTAGQQAPALHGVMSIDEALGQLLAPAGLSFRRTGDGVILVTAAPQARSLPVDNVGAVSEILVTARHALNTDIPRSPDDIQPYRVADAESVETSGAQTVENFLKTRVAANTTALTYSQAPVDNKADPRSQVDLRGLGTNQTLVLVDGRRLPSVPAINDFLQPNLNGIPLDAIARIETLSSTAGGIYGPGATGGVVNIVLKRRAEGFGLGSTVGVSDRGDGKQWRLDGHAGFTSQSGATRLSLAYSHADEQGLTYGDRSFVSTARQLRLTLAPGMYLSPLSPSLNIQTLDRNNLVLNDALGGSELASFFTTIPVSVMGTPAQTALLVANAGQFDQRMAFDATGAGQNLTTTTRSDGLVLTLRQALGARLDAFIDILAMEDRGTAAGPSASNDFIIVPADAVGNPFNSALIASYPIPGAAAGAYRTTDRTGRATTGLVARLPRGWNADIDFTVGRFEQRSSAPWTDYSKLPSPFADPAAFAAALADPANFPVLKQSWSDTLYDGNVRLAGPLFRLPGGPLTMTVTGEWRRETSPGLDGVSSVARLYVASSNPLTQTTSSAYGELRAPLVAEDSAFWPLRGLEVQLAGRIDRFSIAAPSYDNQLEGPIAVTIHARPQTTAETLGLRFSPLDGVMVRASYATGYLPPRPFQVATNVFHYEADPEGALGFADPVRGDQIGSKADVALKDGGSPDVKPEKARSLSAGIVLTPSWIQGLRVSVDYTHIAKSREINFANDDIGLVLDNPKLYASRLTRAPLTAEDIAEGYAVGVITAIDTTAYNEGRTTVDVVDLDIAYDRVTAIGAFHVYGQGSWEPTFKQQAYPGAPVYQLAGYADGPLRLKGNAGVTWSRGRWTAGGDVQAFGGYKVTQGGAEADRDFTNQVRLVEQGADAIRPQAYLNLFAIYRAPPRAGRPALDYSLRIENVMNQSPPLYVPPLHGYTGRDSGIGYSAYGDPRGRRVLLGVRSAF